MQSGPEYDTYFDYMDEESNKLKTELQKLQTGPEDSTCSGYMDEETSKSKAEVENTKTAGGCTIGDCGVERRMRCFVL